MEYFFRPFAKELEEFVAEFEPVAGQVGGIVLFGSNIVGIEVMPTQQHWLAYWQWLIRGCYGAQLLKLRKMGILQKEELALPSFPSSVHDISAAVNTYFKSLEQAVVRPLKNMQMNTVAAGADHVAQLESVVIKTGTGGGDLVALNRNPVYLSMVI